MNKQDLISMIGTFAFLATILSSGAVAAAGRTVKGVETWEGEVHVKEMVIVEKGAILRILPGTRVLLSGEDNNDDGIRDGSIMVSGNLIVEGERKRPVIFSPLDPRKPWGEIFIKEGKGVIRYAVFERAQWGLHVHDGDVTVEHAMFQENEAGVKMKGTGAAFSRCTFRDNGIALRFWDGGPTVADTVIENNNVGLFYREGKGGGKIVRSVIANREWDLKIGDWAVGTLDVSGNYWGTAEDEKIRRRIQDFREDDRGSILILPTLPHPPVECGADLPEYPSFEKELLKEAGIGGVSR